QQQLETTEKSLTTLQTQLSAEQSLVQQQTKRNKSKNMTIVVLSLLSFTLAIISGLLAKSYFVGMT
ncbi:MAG TPA: hypothetical protein ACFCUY_10210, partial [Xenococcaceae cyanobacterium]